MAYGIGIRNRVYGFTRLRVYALLDARLQPINA